MIKTFRKTINTQWQQWVNIRNPAKNPKILNANNVYIFPSAFGWIYAFVVISLFTGAINYQMSTAFLMTFLLAIIGLVSAWEAHANLKDMQIQLISIEDAELGTPAQLKLFIQTNDKQRFGLEFQIADQPKTRLEKIPTEGLTFILPIKTNQRGCFSLPRIVISSYFPFGLFRVWGYAFYPGSYYVYPAALSPDFWPPPSSVVSNKTNDKAGNEDLYELKQVENPWHQPNRIAWKTAAKGQGWYLKTMDTTEAEYWILQLADLPRQDVEKNLQHLSYWLHEAELKEYRYALKLANRQTQVDQGEEHLQYCLRQLALYQ